MPGEQPIQDSATSAGSTSLESVCTALAEIAPLRLAESWDNVGLLVGDRRRSVQRIMSCLTISPPVVGEAIERRVDLIVAHHPLPFKPLPRITADTIPGRMVLQLIENGTAIYSAHTAFDSAATGINQAWAEQLGLKSIAPLVEATAQADQEADLGSGRFGILPRPITLDRLIAKAARLVGASGVRRVGDGKQKVSKVALACGSGGSFLSAARRRGCDALITGEATFHTCLEAEASPIGLGLLGHYWSERFAMERLAEQLAETFSALDIWASQMEKDPISRVRIL